MSLGTLRSFYLLALLLTKTSGACAKSGFITSHLPGEDIAIQVLYRAALVDPVRYRVIFVPGSGCTGMQPVSDRYFRGLLHAEVLVLHKPGVNPMAGITPECSPEFIRRDSLSRWTTSARIALHADNMTHQRHLPLILVGASEGAEILPLLASEVANLHGLVMISSSGLDPQKALKLQANKLGASSAWRDLAIAVNSAESEDVIHQGRSLKYWRDLWSWQTTIPLLAMTVPVMQIFGEDDAQVPDSAYVNFYELYSEKKKDVGLANHICVRRMKGADHGLQSAERDGIQWLWAQLENWARMPDASLCDASAPAP